MLKPITQKKSEELLVAEKFLPHFNHTHEVSYRIDYVHLLERGESDTPDISLVNLRVPNDSIPVEIKKAGDLSSAEAYESRFGEFLSRLSAETKGVLNKYSVSLSISLNGRTLLKKNTWDNDLSLLSKHLEGFVLDSPVTNRRMFANSEFQVITEVSIEPSVVPTVGLGGSSPAGHLDPLEKVRKIVESNTNYAEPKTILVLHIFPSVNQYYTREIDNYLLESNHGYAEVWLLEMVLGGQAILFRAE